MFNELQEYGCCCCKYATLYIPYWTYPYSEPYCSKGHGKCETDKLCSDFELMGRLSR